MVASDCASASVSVQTVEGGLAGGYGYQDSALPAETGLFYGIRPVIQLTPPRENSVHCMYVKCVQALELAFTILCLHSLLFNKPPLCKALVYVHACVNINTLLAFQPTRFSCYLYVTHHVLKCYYSACVPTRSPSVFCPSCVVYDDEAVD